MLFTSNILASKTVSLTRRAYSFPQAIARKSKPLPLAPEFGTLAIALLSQVFCEIRAHKVHSIYAYQKLAIGKDCRKDWILMLYYFVLAASQGDSMESSFTGAFFWLESVIGFLVDEKKERGEEFFLSQLVKLQLSRVSLKKN